VQVTVWPRDPGTRAQDAPKGGVGGIHFTDLGEILSVTTSTRMGEGFGGFDLAAWTVRMHPGYVGGFFLPRDYIEVTHAGVLLFAGEYSEQQVDSRDAKEGDTYSFHARGYAHVLADYPAVCFQSIVDAPDYEFPTTQLATSDSDTTYAWDYARGKGMQVYAAPGDLPVGPYGETAVAASPMLLRDLLTAHLLRNDNWWACWGPTLEVVTLPTTPTLLYDQPTTLVAIADTDYYSSVGLYYVHTAPGTSVDQCTIAWGGDVARMLNIFDYRGIVLDMRGLGLQSSATMLAQAQSMYEQVKGRYLLTGSLTLGPDSGLTAANGGVVDIETVRAGQMMKLSEIRDSLGFLLPDGDTRFVVGATEHQWSPEGESVTITPMGSVARNLGDVLRSVPPDSASAVAGAA
jgi:hypothetical protein